MWLSQILVSGYFNAGVIEFQIILLGGIFTHPVWLLFQCHIQTKKDLETLLMNKLSCVEAVVPLSVGEGSFSASNSIECWSLTRNFLFYTMWGSACGTSLMHSKAVFPPHQYLVNQSPVPGADRSFGLLHRHSIVWDNISSLVFGDHPGSVRLEQHPLATCLPSLSQLCCCWLCQHTDKSLWVQPHPLPSLLTFSLCL